MTEREKVIADLNLSKTSTIDGYAAHHYGGVIHGITTETLCDALALLKAQEPVEPIQGRDDQDEDIFCCGACGAVVGETFIGPPGECEVRDNYCPECGRAVKWE